jgi:hypothetical protein
MLKLPPPDSGVFCEQSSSLATLYSFALTIPEKTPSLSDIAAVATAVVMSSFSHINLRFCGHGVMHALMHVSLCRLRCPEQIG